MIKSLFILVLSVGIFSLNAADLSKLIDGKRWRAFESSIGNNPKALELIFPIDHKGGEKAYPIGWPRMYTKKLNVTETNWTGAKSVNFKVETSFTGTTPKLVASIIIFYKGDKGKDERISYNFNLVKDKSTSITIPLERIKNLKEITKLGFSISENNYKHGEKLVIKVSDFALLNK